MQLASVPKSVVTANQRVASALQDAHQHAAAAKDSFAKGAAQSTVTSRLTSALDAATDARSGLRELGSKNVLDGTFQRFTTHSVRHLEDAIHVLTRPTGVGADGRTRLERLLADAEGATRLGSAAGERSIARSATRPSVSSGARTTSSSTEPGTVVVDGQRIDSVGNPVRGDGGSWSGPDGQRFGSDGTPSRGDGGSFGPDGEGFSGI